MKHGSGLLTVVLVFSALLLAPALLSAADALGTVTVTASPTSYTGKAPAKLKFTGKILILVTPMTLNYQWVRSDGAKGEVKVVSVKNAKTKVLEVVDSWSFGKKGDNTQVWETLIVQSGNQHLTNDSPKVQVTLK